MHAVMETGVHVVTTTSVSDPLVPATLVVLTVNRATLSNGTAPVPDRSPTSAKQPTDPSHPLPQPSTRLLAQLGAGGLTRGKSLSSSAYRSPIGTNFLSVRPTNSDCGRMRRLLLTCSSTFALYPTDRATANVGVNMSPGSPTAASTAAE